MIDDDVFVTRIMSRFAKLNLQNISAVRQVRIERSRIEGDFLFAWDYEQLEETLKGLMSWLLLFSC
jgi:hypothetical protein